MENMWWYPLQLLVNFSYLSLWIFLFSILTQKLDSVLGHFSFSYLSFIYDNYGVWTIIRAILDVNQGSVLNPDYTLE